MWWILAPATIAFVATASGIRSAVGGTNSGVGATSGSIISGVSSPATSLATSSIVVAAATSTFLASSIFSPPSVNQSIAASEAIAGVTVFTSFTSI